MCTAVRPSRREQTRRNPARAATEQRLLWMYHDRGAHVCTKAYGRKDWGAALFTNAGSG